MKKLLLVILVSTLFVGVVGCSNPNVGPAEVLDITLENDVLAFGQTTEITASAKDRDGNTVSVEPEWRIASGPGALSSEVNKATYFATDREYAGEVKVHAKAGDIIAEKTIEIVRLLRGEKDLIEELEPDNYNSSLPDQTRVEEKTGEPIDYYRSYQLVYDSTRGTYHFKPVVYIENGSLVDPYVDEELGSRYLVLSGGDKFPEKLHVSWRYHYELLYSNSYVYPDNSSYENGITYGTETTSATEFAKETTKEISVGGSWGWGSVEASLSQTVSNKTTESLTIAREDTDTFTFNFIGLEEKPNTLCAVFQRVVTFYISDSQGVPVNEAGIFADYNLSAREFTVKDKSNFYTKSWRFE